MSFKYAVQICDGNKLMIVNGFVPSRAITVYQTFGAFINVVVVIEK